MALQFGVNIWPHQWRDVSRIEELGYDSAWTSEHIFFYFPTFDALTSLAAMAALTSRIRLGTAVLLLPLRPAALAAKEIASVDVISGGRLILGAGIGGEYTKEFEAVGVPVRERGALADGYFPYLFSPERFRDGLAKAREYAEKAGRDPNSITGAIYQFIALADTYDEAKTIAAADLSRRYNQPFEKIVDRYVVMGNADDCARRLADFAEAGVEHFILVPIVPAPADFMPHVGAYARDVLPKLR